MNFRLIYQNQFIRFILAGILNTFFGYTVFAMLIYLGLHYTLACLLATIMGICFNFKTLGKLVFNKTHSLLFYRFFLVYTVSYFLNISLLKMNSHYIPNIYLNSASILPLMVIITYYLNKYFVYRALSHETH